MPNKILFGTFMPNRRNWGDFDCGIFCFVITLCSDLLALDFKFDLQRYDWLFGGILTWTLGCVIESVERRN
jgi:hypothetical protein